ncbi:Uu.00g033060.m01.CDS01 [Anthostomella pinea]|uniref:Uu.00g033060.m01.CDS01 n=1 Tax=Anthostomella pinea TaxID=933095 RepID=A0AAI8V3X4_9PEZI|nr:Uu.00g033060.m01.CDS01 [Anthostomella pinea]
MSPLVLADFWIYHSTMTYSTGGNVDGYSFFDSPPDCDFVNNYMLISVSKDDVSGHKSGARCDGCDYQQPTLIEWNNKMGHFTAYSDRDWAMVDTDGNVKGHCQLATEMGYTCDMNRNAGRS